MRYVFALLLGLVFTQPVVAQAPVQKQKFAIAVDTAGVAEIGPDTYATWVYAVTAMNAFPSSGILVAFDCTHQKVMRLAHVKYQWNATKTGVEGPIVEEKDPTWVDITIPKMFELVCSTGRTHGPSVAEPTKPKAESNPGWRSI